MSFLCWLGAHRWEYTEGNFKRVCQDCLRAEAYGLDSLGGGYAYIGQAHKETK